MIPSVQRIKKDWGKVELEVLTPNPLKIEHFELMAEAHAFADDFETAIPFLQSLPLKIAAFKKKPRQILISEAHERTQERGAGGAYLFSDKVQATNDSFRSDIQKINLTLLNANCLGASACELGFYKEPRRRILHKDLCNMGPKSGVVYIARISALPCQAIDGSDIKTANTELLKSIAEACQSGAESALQSLHARGILKDMELDQVHLMGIGEYGTWHTSSAVPKGGACSVFLQSGGTLHRPHHLKPG